MAAAAASAGTTSHGRPRLGPLRRAALAACTAALHAVTALCQSSIWLDVLLTTLLLSGDKSWVRQAESGGSVTAGEHTASVGLDWRVTLTLASLARAVIPGAIFPTAQFAYGCLDLCSLCARLLIPLHWQTPGALALALIIAGLYAYLTRCYGSLGTAQPLGTQAQPSQREQLAGSGTAGNAGRAARGAAHVLFALCYWVPAGRPTGALLSLSFRCLSKAWRFVTFRRVSSVGLWPLLPAVFAGAALEQWAWQATAAFVALQHHRTGLELLRACVPLEDAGCWPLLALRRCLQLAVIQLSGQPAAAVLGSPPFPVPYVIRLMKFDRGLAHLDSAQWRATAEQVERDLRVNTFHVLFGGLLLCGVIVNQLQCVALLVVVLRTLNADIAKQLRRPAGKVAATSSESAAVASSQAGTSAASHSNAHSQPSAQTAGLGGAGSSLDGTGLPAAALVFSAAGVGEQGAVQRAHGSRQRHRQPQEHHERPQLQPGFSGTAAAEPGPAVPAALAQSEEPSMRAAPTLHALPSEPAVPASPALSEGTAVKQCAACGALRGEGDRKLRKCSGCMSVRYCSPACAKKHWPAHKQLCKQVQQQRQQQQQ